ncbi:MAG TPA: hypothetical protein VLT84_13000, partial [Acidobacteriota bacterium]|nr:hypothetical protein [Acidobacteriota bacterium]
MNTLRAIREDGRTFYVAETRIDATDAKSANRRLARATGTHMEQIGGKSKGDWTVSQRFGE